MASDAGTVVGASVGLRADGNHPDRRFGWFVDSPQEIKLTHYPARVHQTLRVTPAMEAGIANRAWSIEEIVGLLDRRSAVAA